MFTTRITQNNQNKTRRAAILGVTSLMLLPFASQAEEWQFEVGIGGFSTNDAWTGVDSYQGVVPILSASYGNWSFGGGGIIEYQLLEQEDFGFSVGLGYRDDGYDDDGLYSAGNSKSIIFDGYSTPQGDLTVKVDGYWQFLNLSLEQDVSGHSKGLTADLGAEVPLFSLGEDFMVQAEANIHWQSSDYVNHIYGISGSQIDNSKGRVAYQASSATNYSLGLSAFYQLNKDWRLIASSQYTKLDDEISDSPLIDKDNIVSHFIGAVYSF